MVSNASIVAMVVSLMIAFLLPIGLCIYMCKARRASVKSFFIGGLIFFFFQGVTRIPLLQMFSKTDGYELIASNVWVLAIFLGLSAALFEEFGRLFGFRFLLKDRLDWKNGVTFGIGHGGVEAILLVGLTNINNIIYSLMINAGSYDNTIGAALPEGMGETIKEQLINISPVMFLTGGIERIFVISLHIALSLLVIQTVIKKDYKYLLYAILIHTGVNAAVIVMVDWGWSLWIVEGLLAVVGVLALVYTIKVKDRFDDLPKDIDTIDDLPDMK
ncbi:YhfC family intramembrane metalloprotease [Alkaliphilus hydrothermalis]|uniref:Membrane protein YhfC n=1 Tax=Alkaliphilus hydrothermalis TaxID=1482730 RepID=A0ABS2NS67_9FIRM|nr:YhfC family glutamic-type intramembrane protease [Alkaliphilus hydrothermalis]MBM7615802.1 putative membrane protein YhfC [Alkaliphilus hydrothermalis]